MKKLIFSVLFILLAVVAMAQEAQTEYNFLRLPVSAHAAALGGDNITIIEDDPALMFHNPALLQSVSDKQLGLSFMHYMQDCMVGSASFSRMVGDKATWGVAGQFMSYGEMKETDANNVEIGTFSAKDIALSGSFSYLLSERLVGGITARLVNSYIADYSSLAVGVDLGLNYFDPASELSLSAVVKNLGGEVDAYNDIYGKMPIDAQLGVTKRLVGSPLRLSATLVDMIHWDYKFINHLVAGAELLLSNQIYVAAGYNFRRANEMGLVSSGEEHASSHGAGLSLGAGIRLERWRLALSYAKYHVSSSSLMVNLGVNL